MTSTNDFDHFLKKGFIEGLAPGTSMEKLINIFGVDFWSVKETEVNGLIYGIVKIGFIEFHIYNEKINGISYRPEILFSKKDFKGVNIPWISKKRSLIKIESEIAQRNITYKKYTIKGPLKNFETAGAHLFGLEDCEHTFIDTEGGVTFLFEENNKNGELETYQVCKYYDIHKENKITTA
ncbi:hypothetical protein OX283_009875 [Flavobacterium sp. SUN052]|uniref:hypothetical protein n=1 Tax=Flavobacterium sp. SUN052 TaxID=3002441 RepID=UPI00237E7B64|nr:hypothetical protein [Flavobacterium sp. SUN052]MEC4004964.1 hypothetical protein [Flavobacterium sp. SUN052]